MFPRTGPVWLRWIPCVLLATVALHQGWRVHTDALSPWSGGGFGMFSTTDAGPRRHLHAFVLRPGLLREVEPPATLAPLVRRTLRLPSPANLRDLAVALADVPTPDHGPPTAVRLQVWRTRHAPGTLDPSSELLRAIEVPLSQESVDGAD